MKKGFKRLTTILASAMLVASMSLTAFAGITIDGSKCTYSGSSKSAYDAYGLHTITVLNENKLTSGKVIASVNTNMFYNDLMTSWNVVNKKGEPVFGTNYPVLAKYTYDRVNGKNVFYRDIIVGENSSVFGRADIRRYCAYKKNGNYYIDLIIDIEYPDAHVLPGFEVKISTPKTNWSKENVTSVATINDIEYCGNGFYDDARTVVYATVKVPQYYEYKNFKLKMNNYDVDTLKISSYNNTIIYK